MKRKVLSSVLAASLLVVTAVFSAYAGQSARLTAKVPFAFSVGEMSLPAGDYTLYGSSTGIVRIQSAHGGGGFSATHPGRLARNDGKPKLVFHRYGDQYFLSEVINGMDDESHKLPVSKLEKDHIGAGSHSVAENSRQPDVVVFGTR